MPNPEHRAESALIIPEPEDAISSANTVSRLQLAAAQFIVAAGLSLAIIGSGSANASPAKLPPVPGAIQPAPESDFITGLEPSAAVDREDPLEVGVATYNWEHDTPDSLFSEMNKLGMTGARLSLSRFRADEDLADIWEQLPEARKNGIEPTINLGQHKEAPLEGFPTWAADMAEQLPGVKRFVILNEVNSPLFSADSMEENVDVLYKTYNAIKQVRPDAEIGGFGLASQYDPKGFLEAAKTYAEKKYDGLHSMMDYLDVHIYYKPDKAETFLKDVEAIWDGPIVVGEAGYGVENSGQSYESDGFVAEEDQAKYFIELIKVMLEHPQVIALHNYRLANSADPTDLKTGLITVSGEKLLSYFAIMKFLNSSSL